MAKQKSFITFTGTLGGLNFYYRNGVPVVRQAGGGFNGKAIKTKASMQRVRENASEFGHCSSVKKHYRLALKPLLGVVKDPSQHGRMMTLFTKLKDLDTGNVRGQRRVAGGVATAMGKKLLREFDYSPACDVKGIVGGDWDFDFGTGVFTVTDFTIKRVPFPEGATHVGLQLGRLHFDFATMEDGLAVSAPLVLDADFAGTSISLTVDAPSQVGTAIVVLQLRFYQGVDGELYALEGEGSVGLRVLGVV